MTRFASAALCAVAIALTGGCADRTVQDSDSSAAASTSAALASSASSPETAAAPATASTTAAASPCESATTDTLYAATQLRYGDNIVQPFTVGDILCSGEWAKASIPPRPSYQNGGVVLYHYIDGAWSAVQFGSGFDCEPEGVPAANAVELEC